MITREKLEHHITHLQEKHHKVDNDITELYKMHGNDLKIETLKKVKLHIKDEIEQTQLKISKL